jgi:predicted branched-subunit amino acid permease
LKVNGTAVMQNDGVASLRKQKNTVIFSSASTEVESSFPRFKLLAVLCSITPVSMLFGMIAYKADWSFIQIFLINLLGFSGSGQYAALPLSESGAGLLTIVFVTTIVGIFLLRFHVRKYYQKVCY